MLHTCLSASQLSVSTRFYHMVHSTVVCLLYDPLSRAHSVGPTQYSIHVCSRVHSYSTMLMSVIGSKLPICIVYLLVVVPLCFGHTYLSAISTAVYCTLDSTVESIPQLCLALLIVIDMNFFLCPIFCHRVHYIHVAACLRFRLL